MSPILNYTTKVPVSRTISQIQAKLVEHGARAVIMEYGDDGRVKALAFEVPGPKGTLPIRLPIDTEATQRVLKRQWDERLIESKYTTKDHAYRVAWRIIKDWIEAQCSLLETEMVKMEEIFLGYVITPGGQTIYQVMAQKGFLLGPGKGDEK
jgi:hypothetical protein